MGLLFFTKKGNAKECSKNYRTIALISHASKLMLKILQARLQQYVNRELPDVQAGFFKHSVLQQQLSVWSFEVLVQPYWNHLSTNHYI